MSEVKVVYQVPEIAVFPDTDKFLYCRINSSGGISWFESLADLVAHDTGCADEEVQAAIEHLERIARARYAETLAAGVLRKWEETKRCSGWPEERKDGYKVYARHAAGDNCPWHGDPESSRHRIAKYIGITAKTDKMEEFTAARENWAAFVAARDVHRACVTERQSLVNKLLGVNRSGWY